MTNDTEISSRVRRRELLSPFNFAAYYLPHVLAVDRILYLDTDTVVRTDVTVLDEVDFGGHAAAAVEDCSQMLIKYVNFDILGRYLRKPQPKHRKHVSLIARNNTCVFNRGVVLFDAAKWRTLGLTVTISVLNNPDFELVSEPIVFVSMNFENGAVISTGFMEVPRGSVRSSI